MKDYVNVCFVSKKINEKMKERHEEEYGIYSNENVTNKYVLSSVFIHCKEVD